MYEGKNVYLINLSAYILPVCQEFTYSRIASCGQRDMLKMTFAYIRLQNITKDDPSILSYSQWNLSVVFELVQILK